MKLYDDKYAPNPRRVRIFLAEKGIEIPVQEVSIMKGEHKTPEFRKISPMSQVPALELDDGTCLTETLAICRYFEATNPEVPLFGRTPVESALVEMWQRRAELNLMMPTAMFFRHTNEIMAQLEDQMPEWGVKNKPRIVGGMKFFDAHLKGHDFLVDDYYSVADIVLLTTIDFANFAGVPIADELVNLKAWYDRVSARPSAQA